MPASGKRPLQQKPKPAHGALEEERPAAIRCVCFDTDSTCAAAMLRATRHSARSQNNGRSTNERCNRPLAWCRNLLEVNVDRDTITDALELYRTSGLADVSQQWLCVDTGKIPRPGQFVDAAESFVVTRPAKCWGTDMLWFFPSTQRAHDHMSMLFRDLLRNISVRESLPPLVCWQVGYIVRRNVETAHFHFDFRGIGNQAFAMMVPLSDNTEKHLLVRHDCARADAAEVRCMYKLGQALAIGDGVYHSSEPGKASRPQVFLHCVCAPDPQRLDKCTIGVLRRAVQSNFVPALGTE